MAKQTIGGYEVDVQDPNMADYLGKIASTGNYSQGEDITSYFKNAGLSYKPVGMIDSGAGLKQVNSDLNKFNQMTTKNPSTPEQQSTEQPKALFTNQAGQEIEFTQDQLNDQNNKDFLSKNGYVMAKANGITGDYGVNPQADVNSVNNQLQNLYNQFQTYNVESDPAFQSTAEVIKSQYAQLRQQMEQTNKAREAAYQTLGYRTGATQYAGGVQMGIEGEELRQANARIADINAQEAKAINDAKQAYQTNNYQKFNTSVNALQDIRDSKQKELDNYNNALKNLNDKLAQEELLSKQQIRQSDLDTSIAGLMSKGVQDVNEMLSVLNEMGGDFTAEEIAKSMNLMANKDTLAGLDQDYRTYAYLQQNQPQELENMGISSYTDYLRRIGDAKREVKTRSTSGGGTTTTDYGTTTDISSTTQLVDRNGKPIKLTATQVDSIVGFDSALSQLQEVKNLIASTNPNTGPISGRLSEITRMANAADPNLVELDALLSSIKANFMKAISGAAVSESEVKRLSKFLPSINDTEQNLQIKIKQFEKSLNQQKNSYLSTLGAVQQSQNNVVGSGETSSGMKYKIIK